MGGISGGEKGGGTIGGGTGGFGGVAQEIALALVAFSLMRIAAEACFFMAESGDRQWDIRALLLDLLDEQSRRQDEEVT